MTTSELQALFREQIAAGATKLFYMQQQSSTEAAARLLSHDTATSTFDELLSNLSGYKYTRLVSDRNWPVFTKETT